MLYFSRVKVYSKPQPGENVQLFQSLCEVHYGDLVVLVFVHSFVSTSVTDLLYNTNFLLILLATAALKHQAAELIHQRRMQAAHFPPLKHSPALLFDSDTLFHLNLQHFFLASSLFFSPTQLISRSLARTHTQNLSLNSSSVTKLSCKSSPVSPAAIWNKFETRHKKCINITPVAVYQLATSNGKAAWNKTLGILARIPIISALGA